MKIRKGFVSNSSSSSFVCDISGNAESGYDASARDLGMIGCEAGHTMMDHYVKVDDGMMHRLVNRFRADDLDGDDVLAFIDAWNNNPPTSEEGAREMIEDHFDSYGDMNYELLSEMCPICSLQVVTDGMLIQYVDKHVRSKKDLIVEIQTKASSIDEFNALVGR